MRAAGSAGRGRLRASHADREQVIGILKAAFVQGMLDKDEFDLRVGQAFGSWTFAELAAVTADLLPAPAIGRPGWADPAGRLRSTAHRRSWTRPLPGPPLPGSRSPHRWRPRGLLAADGRSLCN
jgi:hypothetical protein